MLDTLPEIYIYGTLCGLVIFFFALDRFIRQRIRKKRANRSSNIASKFGLTFMPSHNDLLQNIDHLMNGQNTPKLANILHRSTDELEIFMADYSHVITSEKSTRRVYHTVVGIRIPPTAVPFFHLQSVYTSNTNQWLKWPEVDIQTNKQFDERFALKSIPPQIDEVRQFFADRPSLVAFCLDHPKYRLTCDGEWLVWYDPATQISLEEKNVKTHLDLAQELVNHLGLGAKGKSVKWDNLDHTAANDGPEDYDIYVKQLKSHQ